LLESLRDFARQRLVNHPGLYDPQNFPVELFVEMGEKNLLGFTDLELIAHGSAILASESGSLGFATAWMIQSLVPLILSKYANLPEEIKTDVKNGVINIALAISEPGAGAHPKFLQTTALKVEGGWRLDGEKSNITNGPIASHIALLAITEIVQKQKRFSMFLVPVQTPGISIIHQSQFDFLRPAQHCGFILSNCLVSRDCLLGQPGEAFETIALPFRNLEDAISMIAMISTLSLASSRSARVIKPFLTDEISLQLGELAGIETALTALAPLLINALKTWNLETVTVDLQLVAMRDLLRRAIQILGNIQKQNNEPVNPILWDMEKMLDIGRKARQLKKSRLGYTYFYKEE